MFNDLIRKAGAKIEMSEVVKDDKNSLKLFLSKALKNSDMVISSGGISMGRYDYVRDVLIELGVEEHFWKVAQKPGNHFFWHERKENNFRSSWESSIFIYRFYGVGVACTKRYYR